MADTLENRAALASAYGPGAAPSFAYCAGWYSSGDGYGGTFQCTSIMPPYTDPGGRPVVVDAQSRVWVGVQMEPSLKIVSPGSGNMVGYGNSVMAGDAATSYNNWAYFPQLGASLGLPAVNYALAGSGIFYSCFKNLCVINPCGSRRGGIAVIEADHNDAIYGNSLTPAKVYSELVAFLSDWFGATSQAANSSPVQTGWSVVSGFHEKAPHVGTGSALLSSTSSGSLLTGTFSGPNFFLRSMAGDGTLAHGLGDLDLWIDDDGSYLPENRVLKSWQGDFQYDTNPVDSPYTLGHLTAPLFGLGLGSHTFGVKAGAAGPSGGTYWMVDTFDTIRPPYLCDPVLVYAPPRPNNYALIGPGTATPASFDAIDAAMLAAIRVFTSQGYPVAFARTNDFLDPANLAADHEHPLNRGHTQMMMAGLAQFA